MTGDVKVLAGINIFLASIIFGSAFIRTQSLTMHLGPYFMANLMQGGSRRMAKEYMTGRLGQKTSEDKRDQGRSVIPGTPMPRAER